MIPSLPGLTHVTIYKSASHYAIMWWHYRLMWHSKTSLYLSNRKSLSHVYDVSSTLNIKRKSTILILLMVTSFKQFKLKSRYLSTCFNFSGIFTNFICHPNLREFSWRDKIFCEDQVLGMKINAESAECRPTRQPSGAGRACGDRSWAGPGNGWSRWCPTTPRSPSGSNHLGAPLSSSRNTEGELAPRLTWTDDFFIDFGSRLLINNTE